MACPFQHFHRLALGRIGLALQLEVGEETVAAVALGRGERLAGQRNQPASMLPRALRQKLFQPGAEIGDPRRGNDRHLVAAEARCRDAHGDPELYARILRRWHVRAAGSFHLVRRLEEAFDVETHRRRRHQTELRQHGIPAADRGHAMEDMGKAQLLGAALQRGTGIGHRDEVFAGLILASHRAGTVEKICHEDVGLQRAAGFGGDDEQRLAEIDRQFDRLDL